jgi:hypothetical protein
VSIALAALLAIAIGWVVLRRLSQPQPVEAMAAVLARSEGAAAAVPWTQAKRSGNIEVVPFVHESFRFGVRRFDLAVALETSGRGKLGAALDRMCRFLITTPDFTTPAVSDACARVGARNRDTPPGQEAARAQAKANDLGDRKDAAILQDAKELSEGFEPAIVALGSWAEACRLGAVAAGGGTPDLPPAPEAGKVLDFLRGGDTRHLLDEGLATHSGTDRSDLDDEGRERLLHVQQQIGKLPAASGPGASKAMAEVGDACTSLLKNYDDD